MVAPVKTDGVVQFQPWAPGKDVELEVLLAKQSPKEFVFLQTETYLKFGYRMEEPAEATRRRGDAPMTARPRRPSRRSPTRWWRSRP